MYMKTKTISFAMLSLALSLNAYAGGSGNHQHMDHSQMNQGQMDHSNMDHSKMNHSAMSQEMSGHSDGHSQGHSQGHTHGNQAVSASGEPGKASEVTKTIELEALDSMRFDFKNLSDVNSGDVVRFVITNKGQINHEFSVGTAEEQKSHQAMMRKMPDMVHEDGNSITIKPGQTRELIWKFHGDPKVVFACNIPGHAEAGMMHSLNVNHMLSSEDHMSGSEQTVVD